MPFSLFFFVMTHFSELYSSTQVFVDTFRAFAMLVWVISCPLV